MFYILGAASDRAYTWGDLASPARADQIRPAAKGGTIVSKQSQHPGDRPLDRPFLTDLDSRAAIKGSRDPLGLGPVWTRFGRQVVTNLSTVSNSLRGFTTLLLGYHFAQEARAAGKQMDTLELFLRFEQLAGYARQSVDTNDTGFRGTERVADRLSESKKVSLGMGRGQQILSQQKVYGLWGLFSVPARNSGWLADLTLTAVARDFVEHEYVAALSKRGVRSDRVVEALTRAAPLNFEGKDAGMAQGIASLLARKVNEAERDFYWHYLAECSSTDATGGCQQQLARLIMEQRADGDYGMSDLRETMTRARKRSGHQALVAHLEAIERLEQLLVPMSTAFLFLLGRNTDTIAEAAVDMRKQWGKKLRHIDLEAIRSLSPRIVVAYRGDEEAGRRFVNVATALRDGDYEESLRLLIAHNGWVMQTRHGADPWVRLERGKLDVRYLDESATLPSGIELKDAWRNTYFINSLGSVVHALRA